MGWWQETEHPNSPIKLACLPAQVNACDYQLDLVFGFLSAFISALHTVDPMGSMDRLCVACNVVLEAERLGDEVRSKTLLMIFAALECAQRARQEGYPLVQLGGHWCHTALLLYGRYRVLWGIQGYWGQVWPL